MKARRHRLWKRLLTLRLLRSNSDFDEYLMSAQRRARRFRGFLTVAVTALVHCGVARADNFVNVFYDIQNDQLVVTMRYRGTNPSHEFTLQWGQCKGRPDGHSQEIVAEVLDSQWQDAAQRVFKVTTRFSLADLTCRPAAVTLRTAPRFYYTLQIPAKSTRQP